MVCLMFLINQLLQCWTLSWARNDCPQEIEVWTIGRRSELLWSDTGLQNANIVISVSFLRKNGFSVIFDIVVLRGESVICLMRKLPTVMVLKLISHNRDMYACVCVCVCMKALSSIKPQKVLTLLFWACKGSTFELPGKTFVLFYLLNYKYVSGFE